MLVQACQLNPKIGDVKGNLKKIFDALERGRERRADITIFSELVLTGYTPDDLLFDPTLIQAAEDALKQIAPLTKERMVVVGLPRRSTRRQEKPLFNSAAVFIDGELAGFKDKTLLPTYDVFDERRYFEPGDKEKIFEFLGRKIAITICEDAWQRSDVTVYSQYVKDPILDLAGQDVDLLLNLSASPYSYNRLQTRIGVFSAVSQTLKCPTIVCNQIGGNDELLFDGHSFHINEKGETIQIAKGFVEDDLWVDLGSHVCPCTLPEFSVKDLYNALILGVRDYFHKLGFKKAIVGLSGGIDSALVAVIAVAALGAQNVQAYFLPTRFTSEQSGNDARQLAENLGIAFKEIDIDPLFSSYLDELEAHLPTSVLPMVEENLQPRIRGNLLMAISNQEGSLLLNTSNKSELAVGYATLYGDLCGALSPLGDVLKTSVYELARFCNREKEVIPNAILSRPPTAELRENQLDADTLLPYDALDPILERLVEKMMEPKQVAEELGAPLQLVEEIQRKIHLAEYKRRQAPPSVRVTSKCFSKGRVVPIVSTLIF